MKKKRKIVTIVCVILPILVTLVMLVIKQRTLDYGNVENFCYKIQEAGKLIPPDPKLCEKYVVEKDRYGSVILTVTGRKGEEVSCEMTPDYQIVDDFKKTTNFKYLVLSAEEDSILVEFTIGCILAAFYLICCYGIMIIVFLFVCLILAIKDLFFKTDFLENTKLARYIKNKVKQMNNKH